MWWMSCEEIQWSCGGGYTALGSEQTLFCCAPLEPLVLSRHRGGKVRNGGGGGGDWKATLCVPQGMAVAKGSGGCGGLEGGLGGVRASFAQGKSSFPDARLGPGIESGGGQRWCVLVSAVAWCVTSSRSQAGHSSVEEVLISSKERGSGHPLSRAALAFHPIPPPATAPSQGEAPAGLHEVDLGINQQSSV